MPTRSKLLEPDLMNRIPSLALIIACLFLATACQQAEQPTAGSEQKPTTGEQGKPEKHDDDALIPSRDYHSYANAEAVRISHALLDLQVDFEGRSLRGSVLLSLEKTEESVDTLILDTRDLKIEKVTTEAGEALAFALGADDATLGQALEIQLPPEINQVKIDYATRPEASGLQWLTAQQTGGGKHPFLFTQSQAIHARSWIPLQDTPQVRFTYTATIRTPAGLRAVMSANNDPDAEINGVFEFEMPQPIPSYLMALAVGDLAFQAMSDRTGVYAEPEILAAAADEFADTESMMQTSEALFGPYRWGRYDLLILPPSFPFGGMENPRLSFITPTVIAGDRSLVALIAHELAHSWSGNLVTNATWRDLWLNEGFTVYLEARIMEEVFGKERRAMEDVLGYQSLQQDFEDLAPGDQALAFDLRNRDPDESFSSIAYEKGRFMLVYLEDAFGREIFDEFLRDYFDQYGFKSVHTEQFLEYLDTHLLSAHPGRVSREQVEQWVFQPGMPDTAVLPSSDAFEQVDAQRRLWISGEAEAANLETESWTVHQWLYFLNNLPVELSQEQLAQLDQAFSLTTTSNNEIAHSWLLIVVHNQYQPGMERLRDYLVSIGRRKLIVPLYEALIDQEWGRDMASEVFAQAKPGYHPMAVASIESLFQE
jgi:leukotriene A-4 hydrolase/aminopeptidase